MSASEEPSAQRARRVLPVLALAGLLALPGCSMLGRGGTYEVDAEFTRAIGVYPGSPVRQLGIEVGQITDVDNDGDTVRVSMEIDDDAELPADAYAVIVPVTALGERYIQLGPVFESGPTLEDGDVIPTDRTQVPFEIDELLRGLQNYLGAIDPQNATDLVTNLAQIVDGQGEEINDLIGTASDTLGLLADKGDEIGTIVDSLSEMSRTLGGRTAAIQELVRSYDQVSGVLADNDESVNRFILNLNDVATEVRGLLERHDEPLRDDVGTLTTVGRTLQRNISRLRTVIAETPRLFAAAQYAYDPQHNVLPLNNQAEPGVISDLYKSRLRDRLAGLCRRLIVRFTGTPLGSALADSGCSSATDTFWDPLFEVPAPPPPGLPEPPGGGEPPELPAPPVLPAPSLPDFPDDLSQGLDLILGLLDGTQLSALGDISPALVDALSQLSPQQLQGLSQLSPAQMRRLGNTDPDQLPQVLDQMLRASIDPGAILDTPLLPRDDDPLGLGS
jgi:phospholipid/cholesterol/gamma-HCH transport system substrate-binding protein